MIESAPREAALASLGDLTQARFKGHPLFSHQIDGIRRLISGSILLADDRGLGKSAQALFAAKAYHQTQHWPIYVISPKSVANNWREEAQIVGVPIELLSWAKMPSELNGEYVLIADEAHRSAAGQGKVKRETKNGTTKTKRLSGSKRAEDFLRLALAPGCQICWPLTGTPMRDGRPRNLFPLLQAIRHPLARNKPHYEAYYCSGGNRETNGASHLNELYLQLKMFGMVRRTKKECLDLPPMLIQLKQAQLSTDAQKLYDATFRELRESYRKRVAAGKISDQGEHLALLTHYLHAQSLAKAETATEVAEDVLQTGRSVVIYANYTATIDRIREILGQGEVLTGQTTEKRRAVNMARFQAGESRVFLSTIRAGGEGVTLTAAQDIILVDRSWVPDDAAQVQDRINRIGQLGNSITATWIQFGLDSDIDRLLIEKQQNSNWALAGQRPRFGGGGVRDIAVLLAELFGS